QQRLASIVAAAHEESRALREQFEERAAEDRATSAELTAALDTVKRELASEQQLAERRAADAEAARSLTEGLEHRRAHFEQLANEHAARGQALIDERDALARSLGAAQQAARDASSRAG